MLTTSTQIHRAVSVQIERRRFSNWSSLQITITTAEGAAIVFDAFSTAALHLQDVPEIAQRAEVAA